MTALRFAAVYDDAEELLRRGELDLVDIITDPGTHERVRPDTEIGPDP